MQNLFDIIKEHSLVVRCLPMTVVEHYNYNEGDESRTHVNADGTPMNFTIVTEMLDLNHFEQICKDVSGVSPLMAYENWKKHYPNGRKLLRRERIVEHGGWWYVKEMKNTGSTVTFQRKSDKFFAPTIEEAINLFLEYKKNKNATSSRK
jgi:hypothetical protein